MLSSTGIHWRNIIVLYAQPSILHSFAPEHKSMVVQVSRTGTRQSTSVQSKRIVKQIIDGDQWSHMSMSMVQNQLVSQHQSEALWSLSQRMSSILSLSRSKHAWILPQELEHRTEHTSSGMQYHRWEHQSSLAPSPQTREYTPPPPWHIPPAMGRCSWSSRR